MCAKKLHTLGPSKQRAWPLSSALAVIMKHIPTIFILLILVSAISQLGFILNADVINGHFLTFLGILMGLAIGSAYYLFKKHMFLKENNILIIHKKQPWYTMPPNYLLTYTMSVFLGMVVISIINNAPKSNTINKAEYTVVKIGEQRVRFELFEYLKLENENNIITYRPRSNENYSLGNRVMVTIEKGFLGFSRITSCTTISS